jgi:flagellar L-ring protein FlgH
MKANIHRKEDPYKGTPTQRTRRQVEASGRSAGGAASPRWGAAEVASAEESLFARGCARACGLVLAVLLLAAPVCAAGKKPKKPPEPSALDKYLQDALKQPVAPVQPSAGSLWSPSSRMTDVGSDVRAAQVDDLVTIVVSENASAVATGATQTARTSTANTQISALGGPKSPTGGAQNLLNMASSQALNGSGSTSRGAVITATLSARVTHVLPNGYLVLEGTKDVLVNSEHQMVTVRGVIRPADLTQGNIITSNQIAQMEIKIDGKGVVNDAIKRPFILWRLLLGILPF